MILLQVSLITGHHKGKLDSLNPNNPKFRGTSKSRTKFLEAWKKFVAGRLTSHFLIYSAMYFKISVNRDIFSFNTFRENRFRKSQENFNQIDYFIF